MIDAEISPDGGPAGSHRQTVGDIGLELQIGNQSNKKLMMATFPRVLGSLRCRSLLFADMNGARRAQEAEWTEQTLLLTEE